MSPVLLTFAANTCFLFQTLTSEACCFSKLLFLQVAHTSQHITNQETGILCVVWSLTPHLPGLPVTMGLSSSI